MSISVTSSIQARRRGRRRSPGTGVLPVVALCVAGFSLATVSLATQAAGGTTVSSAASDAQPKPNAWSPIDNDRVRVTAVLSPPATAGPLPQVRVWLDGHVQYLQPGGRADAHEVSAADPLDRIVIITELRDTHIAPTANPTTFPLAFPRPNVKKVLENERVVVWDYTWTPGAPTPMHFHDKDIVVTYLKTGALRSTGPDGRSVVNPHYFGFTKFNPGNRTHTEELIEGEGRAVMMELKR
jgi:hypothetical protein